MAYKENIKGFDMSSTAQSSPSIDGFGIFAVVGISGRIHIQVEHSFNNSATKVIPTFSISEGDGHDVYSPIDDNGEAFKMSLSDSPTQAIITDLVPGTLVRFGLEYGGQSSGTITIKTSS